MPHKPIIELYKDIRRAKEGKLFKSFGRAGRLEQTGPFPTTSGALRARSAAMAASIDVRTAKSLAGGNPSEAEIARIRQKAALKGIQIPREATMGTLGKLARKLGRVGGATGKGIGIISLPSQYEEYQEMMKSLSRKEQERAARRM